MIAFQTILAEVKDGIKDLAHRPRNNVPSLDVLRSLAILLVFSGHFAAEFGAPPLVQKFPLMYFGWTGVDLFFVLSGLLIGTQLWKELRRTGRIDIPVFLLRRGLRIWPLYFAFIVFLIAEGLFFGRDLSGIWSDLSFLSNYFHHQLSGGWSLSTEEQFYIAFPLLLFVACRAMKMEQMWLLPVSALVLIPLARFATVQFSGMDAATVRDAMYSPIHTHSDGLAVGALLAWCTVVRARLLGSGSRLRIALPAAMIVLAGGLYVANRLLFNYTCLALVYGGLTALALGQKSAGGFVNWHGFYVLSRLSYGIYLNHFGLLPRVTPWLQALRGKGYVALTLGYLLALLACVAFAFLTFLFIEWPFLRVRERWLESVGHHKPAVALHAGGSEGARTR